MRTDKKIAITIAALLFSACGKDNVDTRLRISAENMTGVNSTKVWVNPSTTTTASSSATWITGENINLNGTAYPVAYDEGFYLNTGEADIPNSLLAVYPVTVNSGGNDVTVTNNGSTGTVTIRNLSVDYRDDGHRILFPMVAAADKSDMRLLFKHLTAGMLLTLTDTCSAKDYTLGSVKIVTYGNGATASPLAAINGVTARWEVQGPTLPGDMIGIDDDVSVAYSSEMHFSLKNSGVNGKALGNNGSISLCVPVTVNRIKTIVVTGYGTDGQQLFSRTKTLGDELTVNANYMYTIPAIKF